MIDAVSRIAESLRQVASEVNLRRGIQPRGVVRRVGDGVAFVQGLESIGFEELLVFDSGATGMAYDLDVDGIGIVLLSGADKVTAGDGVRGLNVLPSVSVGASTLGRILDPLGRPLDDGPPLRTGERLPLFRPSPEFTERRGVHQPLWTGVMVIDAAIPIGRGQRELIIGDRSVGKSALVIDIVAAQKRDDVACVYVVIGQPMSRVLTLRDTLARQGCLENTAIIAADASMPPGMQYLAPYAGASVAEWFREQGRHALVVYDDLTKHADAYRELALLLNRPPGREAFPGDIFYIHAELLERATVLRDDRGGGSVTALPIVETTDSDISGYIPTNLISITDGQIYLDTVRFERNHRPAVDIGRSVSRIGSVAQPPLLRAAARNLRMLISRFESLEALTRVGLDVDASTQRSVSRGRLMRELLRQGRYRCRDVVEQVITLTAIASGWLDDVDPERARTLLRLVVERMQVEQAGLWKTMSTGEIPQEDLQVGVQALACLPDGKPAGATSHETRQPGEPGGVSPRTLHPAEETQQVKWQSWAEQAFKTVSRQTAPVIADSQDAHKP